MSQLKINIEEMNNMSVDDTYFNMSPPKLERILTTHGKHVGVEEETHLPPPPRVERQATEWIGKEGELVYNLPKIIEHRNSHISDDELLISVPNLVRCNALELPNIETRNIKQSYDMERELNPSLVFDRTHYTGLPYDPEKLTHLNFDTLPVLEAPHLLRKTNVPTCVGGQFISDLSVMSPSNPILMRTDSAEHYVNPFGR